MKCFKFLKVVPLFAVMMLAACDSDSSSAEDSPYGDVRYERHVSDSGVAAHCYVYSKGNLYTVLMEQKFAFMGEVKVVSQLELDSPSKIHEEVTVIGDISPDVITDYCNEERAMYETLMGGTVTCSKSSVVADVELGDADAEDLAEARETAVSKLGVSCDDFVEQFKDDVLSDE